MEDSKLRENVKETSAKYKEWIRKTKKALQNFTQKPAELNKVGKEKHTAHVRGPSEYKGGEG